MAREYKHHPPGVHVMSLSKLYSVCHSYEILPKSVIPAFSQLTFKTQKQSVGLDVASDSTVVHFDLRSESRKAIWHGGPGVCVGFICHWGYFPVWWFQGQMFQGNS